MANIQEADCFLHGSKGFSAHGCWYSRMRSDGTFVCKNSCVQQLIADNNKLKKRLENMAERLAQIKSEI